jgi:hypothetical protein
MLFELSFIYLMFTQQIVTHFVSFIDVFCQIALFFQPLIKFFIVGFYLFMYSIDKYVNYIISSDDFISTDMNSDSNEEIEYVILHPLDDYQKAFNTSILKSYKNVGHVYMTYKKTLRPFEQMYKNSVYLPQLYNALNESLLDKFHNIYLLICSLQIVKYTSNKIKMYMLQKTFKILLSNPQLQNNIINVVKNMNIRHYPIINVKTQQLNSTNKKEM